MAASVSKIEVRVSEEEKVALGIAAQQRRVKFQGLLYGFLMDWLHEETEAPPAPDDGLSVQERQAVQSLIALMREQDPERKGLAGAILTNLRQYEREAGASRKVRKTGT